MFDATHFAQFLVNCLAVAGGFLGGFVVAGVLAWWADRSLFRKRTPPRLKQAARFLGGILGAILVALLVFGRGGSGLGGGLGDAVGSGTPGTGDGTATQITAVTPSSIVVGERVAVLILGGSDVREQHFYKVDADPTAKTFDEATAAILAKKTTAVGKPLTVEVRFPPTNAVPRDHPAVKRLEDWARDTAGLTVAFPAAEK